MTEAGIGQQVTEKDKLHLIMQVADEVARVYRIADPCELWGAGLLGVYQAEAKWDGVRPFLPFAHKWVRGAILNSLREAAIDRKTTVNTDKLLRL
jgi:DNA-directed RNA polymerase specialized sigma subunit